MNPYIILLISFLSGGQLYILNPQEKEKWLVEESSAMRVKGSSNINEFTCTIQSRTRKDTLSIDYSRESNQINFIKNDVLINTEAFDCQNAMITSDLKKTLKADDYPYIVLQFISIEKPTCKNFSRQKVKGKIRITLAGKSKHYPIVYQMTPRTDGTIFLKGTKQININDFSLKTPSKLMGLVKVNEEIEVDFNMVLKPIL